MICFASDMLWKWRRHRQQRIPLRFPASVVLYTGCDEERIDAETDQARRLTRMVIYTRQGRSPNKAAS